MKRAMEPPPGNRTPDNLITSAIEAGTDGIT
jgi:hypothetical protein